ncbi:MAG: hypothetical protein IT262_21180 [Saprospiraceae bacterium]|nr:hypothetical protein [Saprospiraceae bacterium]
MTLSVRQKSNIRHFVYYLVNGTLDFELIQKTFADTYHDTLKSNSDLFYKTACVYINQEIELNPQWPDTKKLGKFICDLYENRVNEADFENWKTNFDTQQKDFSSDFKSFTKWFIASKTVPGITYSDYIDARASFVEQCFAIWANVVEIEHNVVKNTNHAIERVEQYIKSYFVPGFIDNLEEWECELHME